MLAFEISLNGKKKCVAGIGEPGVLTTTLTWVLGESNAHRAGNEEMGIRVGSLINRTTEFAEWFQRNLKRGDEITLRIIESEKVDKPKRKRRESAAQRRRQQQAYVQRLAKQFGWKIVKPQREQS